MSDFCMPSLGADMDAGTLVEWLIEPGQAIHRGDIIAVVETQKGAIEIEVFQDGVLDQVCVPIGQEVPVGTVLAKLRTGNGPETTPSVSPPPPNVPPAEPVPVPARPLPIETPFAGQRPTEGKRLSISPAARRRAAELDIDPETLRGTGPQGAISLRDVKQAAAAAPSSPGAARGIDLTEMRKAIAAAMARSKREIPHFYLDVSVDLSPVLDWVRTTNAERPVQERLLTVVPLLKAVALALRQSPDLNGWYADRGFQPAQAINIGTAVSLRGGGLIAPAIHEVDELSLDALMAHLRELVARVRNGRLRSSEMTDATVTVTSLLEDDVETVYPVIYPPQVAVVGFGAITAKPWVIGDGLAIRPVSKVTLAADHRASDGRRGARFLSRLVQLLQEPEKL